MKFRVSRVDCSYTVNCLFFGGNNCSQTHLVIILDTERVVSNSESEEEFCDTSEINPTQVSMINHRDMDKILPNKIPLAHFCIGGHNRHLNFATWT